MGHNLTVYNLRYPTPGQKLKDCTGATFYCPHSLANGNQQPAYLGLVENARFLHAPLPYQTFILSSKMSVLFRKMHTQQT